MKVRELMTRRPIAIPRDLQCGRAALEMRQAEVRHLPVVDAEQRLVGILTSHDLARAEGQPAAQVTDVMRDAVVTLGPEADAAEAAALMIERKLGAVPVVDEQRRLIGILTATDFLVVAWQALRGIPIKPHTGGS